MIVLSTPSAFMEANRIVCCEEVGSLLNLSLFSSLSDCLVLESVSRRDVKFWMLPARLLRVASEGPETAPAAGKGAEDGRICLSWRSLRSWAAGPLDWMMETTGVIKLRAAAHKK